jgi:SAM-dependent methyltransferase
MRLASTFEGCIDTFIGGEVAGWALDRRQPGDSIDIDLYVDGEYATSTHAEMPRPDLAMVSPASQRKGFRFDVKPYVADRLLPRIDLYFGGSFEKIPVNAATALHFNRPFIDIRELSRSGLSPWTPTPPGEIITYITGRRGSTALLQQEYRYSGLVNSADVFNLLLDLGLAVDKPGFSLLDIGCGSGRYAPFLDQFIPDLQYLGIDVWEEAINWAREALSAVRPNLQFALLDHSLGYAGARFYLLPVDRGSTDAAIAMSLFTHLDATATLGYFSELARVLVPDGAAIATFFILDEASEAAAEAAATRAGLPMKKENGVWSYGREGYLDIFYEEAEIRRLVRDAGLEVVAIRRGNWYRPETAAVTLAAYQDALLLRVRPDL